MEKLPLIVIAGPTAAGKTDLSLALAKQFNGEIISADSRTIYRELSIGTAKPEGKKQSLLQTTAEDVERFGIHEAKKKNLSIGNLFSEAPYMVEGVRHWGIDICDPEETFSAADFQSYTHQKIKEIHERGHLPFLVGGTGLYIEAVIDNLSFTSVGKDDALRAQLEKLTQDQLLYRLQKLDREAADQIDVMNRRRLIRAIEIVTLSGKPLSGQKEKGEVLYEVLYFGIETPREELYERIEERVNYMMAMGLVDEVRDLKQKYGCDIPAMSGIGYRQICAFLEGYMKLSDAVEVVKRDTRHYAKRQLTWFKRDDRIQWIKRNSLKKATEIIENFLEK